MTFKEFMLIQRELTSEYGLKDNLEFAKLIYRKISHLKQLDDPTQAYKIACNVTEQSLSCILSSYQKKSLQSNIITNEIKKIYLCVADHTKCEYVASDYINHLLSKVQLYHNFKTDKLRETVQKIIKELN